MIDNTKDESDECYAITLYGFLTTILSDDEASEVFDALELYCRRHGVGIAIDDNKLNFVELVKE